MVSMCNCTKKNNEQSIISRIKNIWKSTEEVKKETENTDRKKSGDYVYKIKNKKI